MISDVDPTARPAAPSAGDLRAGAFFAVASAASFGLAGTIASGLIEVGWSPGAAALTRIGLGALLLLPAAVRALRGRWAVLRREARVVASYGVVAVAACQFFYFVAVSRLPVATALLIEYLSPLLVLAWFWLRHGQRASRITLLGALVALAGLVPVLAAEGGGHGGAQPAGLDLVGVLCAGVAMVVSAYFFIVSASDDSGLPPLALAAGGLVVGGLALAVAGVLGLVPLAASTTAPTYGAHTIPWWAAVALLGLICAAVAYTTGIGAARRLGGRLASFAALTEVIFAAIFAALFLGQEPGPAQLLGGVVVLVGIVLVKVGERDTDARDAAIEPGVVA